MTVEQRLGLNRLGLDLKEADVNVKAAMVAYLALPTVRCSVCDREFSEHVARLHAQRTGHRLWPAGQFTTAPAARLVPTATTEAAA